MEKGVQLILHSVVCNSFVVAQTRAEEGLLMHVKSSYLCLDAPRVGPGDHNIARVTLSVKLCVCTLSFRSLGLRVWQVIIHIGRYIGKYIGHIDVSVSI